MATAQNLTEYERQRLDNIRHKDELMAALKLRSRAASLSSSFSIKRQKADSKMKSYKEKLEKTPPRETTPVVIRRSLRARGMPPPDSGVLSDDVLDGKPQRNQTPVADNVVSKVRTRGPISMRNEYSGSDSGNEVLVGMILGIVNKNYSRSVIKEEIADNPGDGGKPKVITCVLNADGVQEIANAGNSGMSVSKSDGTTYQKKKSDGNDVDECNKGIAADFNDDCEEEIKTEITKAERGNFVECNVDHGSEIGESIGGCSWKNSNCEVLPCPQFEDGRRQG